MMTTIPDAFRTWEDDIKRRLAALEADVAALKQRSHLNITPYEDDAGHTLLHFWQHKGEYYTLLGVVKTAKVKDRPLVAAETFTEAAAPAEPAAEAVRPWVVYDANIMGHYFYDGSQWWFALSYEGKWTKATNRYSFNTAAGNRRNWTVPPDTKEGDRVIPESPWLPEGWDVIDYGHTIYNITRSHPVMGMEYFYPCVRATLALEDATSLADARRRLAKYLWDAGLYPTGMTP